MIVVPEESQVRVLNATGSRIWELCDGSHSVSAIIHRVTDEFSVDFQQAEQDVTDFVTELAEKGILSVNLEGRE